MMGWRDASGHPGMVLLLAVTIGAGACGEAPDAGADPSAPYNEGLALYGQGGEANLRRAIELFGRAVELDSTFAPAWAALARAHASIGGDYNIVAPEETWPAARAAAERAVALDDGLAEAHLAQAYVRGGADWDWTAAELSYQRALELDPDNVEALNGYAWFLNGLGRVEEATSFVGRVRELAPGATDAFLSYVTTGDAAGHQAMLEEQIAADPANPQGYWVSALIHTWEGEYGEAAGRFEQQIPLMEGDVVDEVALLGYVLGRAGQEDEARSMLQRLNDVEAAGRYVSPVLRAWVHSGLGEADEALALLRTGYEVRAHRSGLGMNTFGAVFEPIRDNAGFQDLLREMGLSR